MARKRKMINNMPYERIYSKRQIITGIVTGQLKPGTEKCPDCKGKGISYGRNYCPKCSSSGIINVPRWNEKGTSDFYSMYMDVEKVINNIFDVLESK